MQPVPAAAHELRIQGGQRVQPTPAQNADPVKALHLQKALRAMVDDGGNNLSAL